MIYQLPGQIGYLLHEQARAFHGSGAGWLSIKSFYCGNAEYAIGSRRFVVDDSCYLILNNGQSYNIQIESQHPIESFCLFFAPGFAEAVQHTLDSTADRLLIEPQPAGASSAAFFERTYPHDSFVSPALGQLRAVARQAQPDQAWLVERFHLVMQRLLSMHANIYREVEALPAIRAATREELYRRLHYARDYAAALFTTPITLDEMARVAALSPNHLLRTFKQLFGQTPYQYVLARRIAYAQELLRSTDQGVTDICFAVGFASLGTFSWWFHQRVGVSPTDYRRQNR
jgi:AraC family transcriptional regulator